MMTNLQTNQGAVNFTDIVKYYPKVPFHPDQAYPELGEIELDGANNLYGAVRQTLHRLGLDQEHYGAADWNPLGGMVEPGMTVFIKPNTVRHFHEGGGDVLSVITHGSILRPLLDYVCLALRGKGRIIIGDSQVVYGRFPEAMAAAKIDVLLDWYRRQTGIPIECFDLRMNYGARSWMYGRWKRVKVEQDPRGYTFVDLGDESCFRDIDPKLLRIAIASHKKMYHHHSGGRHEYLIPNSFLESDAVISIPKLKTHRRTAVTLALKNFMGIPALKDTLPHWMNGSPEEGGDQYQYPSIRKRICTKLHDQIQSSAFIPVKFAFAMTKKAIWNTQRIVPFKDDYYEAMWPGNDTLWRTLIDINRIVFYADKKGQLHDTQQRNYFCLLDGIIGGENDGPVSPDPVAVGVLMASSNPVLIDAMGASLMGFDIDKIPLIKKALETTGSKMPLFFGDRNQIEVFDKNSKLNWKEFGEQYNLHFKAHPTWEGHVERERYLQTA